MEVYMSTSVETVTTISDIGKPKGFETLQMPNDLQTWENEIAEQMKRDSAYIRIGNLTQQGDTVSMAITTEAHAYGNSTATIIESGIALGFYFSKEEALEIGKSLILAAETL